MKINNIEFKQLHTTEYKCLDCGKVFKTIKKCCKHAFGPEWWF